MAFGIPNIERIVSNFLEGGTGITAIRNVEYDKQFLWTVDFLDGQSDAIGASLAPPAPFDQFFPASDITIGMGTVQSEEREFGQTSIKFPRRSNAQNLSITFYDDEKRTLQKWMREWINIDIFNNGNFVSGLNDSHAPVTSTAQNRSRVYPTREVRIALLDAYRKEVIPYHFRVYPEGDFQFTGSQDSSATTYSMDFVIVEDLGKRNTSKSAGGLFGFTFDDVKQLIGRFI
jgi:hypothetical protein